MRILPLLAVAATAVSLAACTVNTASPPPTQIVTPAQPATIVTPAPSYMAPSGPTVTVRP